MACFAPESTIRHTQVAERLKAPGLEMRPPLYHPVPLHPNKSDNQRVFRIRDVISWRKNPLVALSIVAKWVTQFL